MAHRFCDTIRIVMHSGNIYDPFAVKGSATTPNVIYDTPMFSGACKAVQVSQNSMRANSDRGNYKIIINQNNVPVDNRYTLYVKKNGVDDELRMTVVEWTHYERNTIIYAMHTKDGNNS